MSEKKQVLMISPRYKPAIGGVEVHVERLASVLSKRGFSVTIATSSHESGLKPIEQIGDSTVRRIPFRWEKNPFLTYLWFIRHFRGLRKYNIVHVHDTVPLLFWYLPLLLLNPRKRVCTTFHGFEKDPIPLFFKILRRIAQKLSSRVICIGSFIEKTYRVRCDRILVGAVEVSSTQEGPRDGLVYVGRVEPDTGVIAYLDVLRDLDQNHDIKTHLTICGGGTLESNLVSRAKEISVDVQMKGVVDTPGEIMGSAHVCLAGGYLSILEAMSLGVPVIAMPQTELKWQYFRSMKDAGGPISIQTTTEGAAREINRLLTDPKLYQEISTKGQNFASRMTWEHMTTEYLELWNT